MEKGRKKKLIVHAVVIGAFAVLITVFSLIKLSEDVSEYFYARGISRAWVFVFGKINGVVGFSVFGVAGIIAAAALVAAFVAIIVLLAKKEKGRAFLLFEKTVIAILTVAFVYVVTAEGCYNRYEMPLEKYEGEQLSAEETAAILACYYDDFAEISAGLEYDADGKSVSPYTFAELAEILREEYSRLDDPYYSPYTPRVKKAIFSKIMSYNGTCGITFQPLGEAAVNYETPNCYLVLTAAHELAHAKGVMRERDANLLAYYILLTSERPYLRYCGYMYSLGYLSSTLAFLDGKLYEETLEHYPRRAATDLALENAFWDDKLGITERISNFFNDLYLKLSGVKEGTDNYRDPSSVTEIPVVTEDGNGNPTTEIVKVVEYSDTARVLISIGRARYIL